MPISIKCPSCGSKLKAPDRMAGRRTKCPKCSAAVDVPVVELTTAPEIAVPAEPPRQDIICNPVVLYRPPQVANYFGIACLVMGVVAILMCWMPIIGMVVGGFGIFVGLIGVTISALRGSGLGFSSVGLMASAIVMLMSWGITSVIDNTISSVGKSIASRRPSDTSQTHNTDALPEPEDAPWIDASQGPVQSGDLKVKVASVVVDYVTGMDFPDKMKSKERFLKIGLAPENTNRNKKVDYRGWGVGQQLLGGDTAELSDNFGNPYRLVTFGTFSRVEGQIVSESVYPGKPLADLLVFEVPLDTVEFLRLTLPAGNVGASSDLRIQIPEAIIQGRL